MRSVCLADSVLVRLVPFAGQNGDPMISIRKFAFAALLAVTALNIAPSLASAQEPASGKFTLTHEVRWSNATIPAGSYKFNFNPDAISPVLLLNKLSGRPATYMILVHGTDELTSASINRLTLKMTADGSYVSSMELPEFGMMLNFPVPRSIEKTVAKAGLIAAASGQ